VWLQATLATNYPNDRDVYYYWTPGDTVNPATGIKYGSAIVGTGYQVKLIYV
jgi:hypothetical protein